MPYHGIMTDIMPMHEGRELPSFTLREIDLPQIKTWEVGGKYYLVVAVKMTGKRQNSYSLPEGAPKSDEVKEEGDFEMVSVKELETEEANKLEKQAFEGALARARSGNQ